MSKGSMAMNGLSPTLASTGAASGCGASLARSALGLLAIGVSLVACSDEPRIPDGERYSESVTGAPGVVLIDDMEDGTQYLLSDNGRVGLWYVYNDASVGSTQDPAVGFPMYRVLTPDGAPDPASLVPPRPCGPAVAGETPFFATETDCAFVARTSGAGQRGWGAGVGLDLNGEGGIKNPFDASEYAGIGFFAIGNVRNSRMRVNVQDVRTTPESAAAADRRGIPRCESFNPDGSDTGRCNDHYGAVVSISNTAWSWIEIPFACMAPGNWGYPGNVLVGTPSNVPLASELVGIQFQIEGPDIADTGMIPPGVPIMDFDFAIDNLSFLERDLVATPPVCPL
jgi:hypothetical protein